MLEFKMGNAARADLDGMTRVEEGWPEDQTRLVYVHGS